jgi:hypothetical protein
MDPSPVDNDENLRILSQFCNSLSREDAQDKYILF